MKRWVCELTIEADEGEVVEILKTLKERLGERMRSRTREAWLAEAERQPLPPFAQQVAEYVGPRGHFRRRGCVMGELEQAQDSQERRATSLWQTDPDGPAVIVYVDEIPVLNQDVLLYGNVYFRTNADGVNQRIDPSFVIGPRPKDAS